MLKNIVNKILAEICETNCACNGMSRDVKDCQGLNVFYSQFYSQLKEFCL
jgi:hypothetical protein